MRKHALLAAAALFATTLPAFADGMDKQSPVMENYYGPTYSHTVFTGGEIARNSWESYLGATWAMNRDISREGILFRVMGARAQYDYQENCSLGGCVPTPTSFEGKMWQGDAMIGYQWVRERLNMALFIGADYISHDISPAHPTNPVSGNEWGLKVGIDLETHRRTGLPYYFALEGTYSTAFETYWLLGRVGANRNGTIFGVEGWLLGDETGNGQRIGGFLSFDRQLRPDLRAEFTFSGGYQFITDEEGRICTSFFGSEGAYATMNVSFAFGGEPRHDPLKP